MAKQIPLVSQYLENISRDILKDHHDVIKSYVSEKHGIYALYKNKKLYYVGLAIDLKKRLSRHLADKHGELWDRFSIYLTVDISHMKELETLFLRILKPEGNTVKGKFKNAENIKRRVYSDVKEKMDRKLRILVGHKTEEDEENNLNVKASDKRSAQIKSPEPALADYISERIRIRAVYKGKTKIAKIYKSGQISFEGKLYDTPTAAAKAATRRPTINGWTFWRFRNSEGDWVKLRELRTSRLKTRRAVSKKRSIEKKPSLAGYFDKSVMLKRIYKGKEYVAWVIKDGRINFEGNLYNSPTMAGKAIIGRTVNGWTFWKYKNEKGEWVKLNELRK